jgi:hypothetical protein
MTFDITNTLKPFLMTSLAYVTKKKQLIFKKFKSADMSDEDTIDDFEDKMETIVVVEQTIMEISGEVIKLKDEGQLIKGLMWECIMPHFKENLKRETFVCKAETLYALCFFADLFEYADKETFEALFVEVIALALNKVKQDADIIQTMSYLIGVSGYRTENGNAIQSLMATLYQFLNAEIANKEENKSCRDNIISALVKLFLRHWNSLLLTDQQMDEVLSVVGSNLPLANDIEESRTINHLIATELSKTNLFLVGSESRKTVTKQIVARIKTSEKAIVDEYSERIFSLA